MDIQSIPYRHVMDAPLLDAYVHDFPSVAAFYPHDLRDRRLWERMRDRARSRSHAPPPAALVSVLLAQNRRFGMDEASLTNIRALADPDTLAVVTGQQIGLFTGPLYTIYKAVTAVRLAERLAQRLDTHVVPVFWMAADDHDLSEINHVHVCPPDGEPVRLELRPAVPEDRRSATALTFGDEVVALIDAFGEALGDAPCRREVIEILRACCPPSASLIDGFARLMGALFKGRGLILADPTDPALKPLGKSVFEREIRHPLASTRAVLYASRALAAAGFEGQIERTSDAVNFFLYEDGHRQALTFRDGHFYNRAGHASYLPEDLLALAERTPEAMTHNVVTRPVVQDTLFPSLAYVGGPAEIAYYAQLGGVYRHFGLPCPVVYPRASLTLVEPRIARILDKHDLALDHFIRGIHQVFDQRLRDEMPEPLAHAFRQARTDLARHFETLGRLTVPIDATLERLAEAGLRKAEFELARLEEKTVQALKRAHKTTRDQLARAEHHLYPNHQLQERVVNVWQYVAQYGFAFMDTLFAAVDEADFAHRVVRL
jgi:bacillithiol biosynthesis cysteine-adding enzyme BshC